MCDERVAVVGAIADDRDPSPAQKTTRMGDVCRLPARQDVAHQLAELAHDRVQLGREASSRSPQSLATFTSSRPRGMWMRLHDCAVDEEQLGASYAECSLETLPSTIHGPPSVPPVDPLPRTERREQVTPRGSRPQDPHDRFHEAPNIAPPATSQHGLDEGLCLRPSLLREELAFPPKHTNQLAHTGQMSSLTCVSRAAKWRILSTVYCQHALDGRGSGMMPPAR